MFTEEVFSNELVYDQNLNTQHYGSAFNRAYAAGLKTVGFQTVASFEERALVSYINAKIDALRARRTLYEQAITTSALAGYGLTDQDVIALKDAARSEGILITDADITRAIRTRNTGSIERAMQRARADERQKLVPSGQRRRDR